MLSTDRGIHSYKKARRKATHHPVRIVFGLAIFSVLCVSHLYNKDWGGHSGGHLPSQFFSRDTKDIAQSPAWMGVGLPPPIIGEKHVRIIVRVHHLQAMATRSLIWSMRSQVEAAKHALPNASNFMVDIVLVATEEVGVPIVHKIAQGTTNKHTQSLICVAVSCLTLPPYTIRPRIQTCGCHAILLTIVMSLWPARRRSSSPPLKFGRFWMFVHHTHTQPPKWSERETQKATMTVRGKPG